NAASITGSRFFPACARTSARRCCGTSSPATASRNARGRTLAVQASRFYKERARGHHTGHALDPGRGPRASRGTQAVVPSGVIAPVHAKGLGDHEALAGYGSFGEIHRETEPAGVVHGRQRLKD